MAQDLEVINPLPKQAVSNTLIVAGSGRSGTTWLGNIIAGDEYRIIFEPFDFRHVPEAVGLGLRPYFNADGDYPQWRPFIKKVLSGNIENEWVDRDRPRLNPSKKPKGILIKEIRANGLLAWLNRNYGCRIVYIMRHPCAVIASRMKLKWETHIDAFLCQPELMHDLLYKYEDVMKNAVTDAEKHAVMWCVENVVPLNQLSKQQAVFCHYEALVIDPEKEVRRILNLLDIDFSESRKKATGEIVLPGWAEQTRGTASGLNNLNKWKDCLSDDEKRKISSVLGAFGIDLYSVDEVMPREKH